MKSKKQSRVDALETKVREMSLLIGTIAEVMKRMPGYEEALEKTKADYVK